MAFTWRLRLNRLILKYLSKIMMYFLVFKFESLCSNPAKSIKNIFLFDHTFSCENKYFMFDYLFIDYIVHIAAI